MDEQAIIAAAEILGPAIMGLMAFMIKGYFRGIQRELRQIGKDISRLEGHMTAVQDSVRSNTIETTKASSELKALWRHVDGGHERASDRNGGKS